MGLIRRCAGSRDPVRSTPTMSDAGPELDIDLLAASLRADAGDLGAFTEALAVKLEEAIPSGVRVHRGRGRPFGPKRVGKIVVDAGDRRLELRAEGPGIETSRARLSAGIVIKTEMVGIDEWIAELSRALAEQARRSETTRQALGRLLN